MHRVILLKSIKVVWPGLCLAFGAATTAYLVAKILITMGVQ